MSKLLIVAMLLFALAGWAQAPAPPMGNAGISNQPGTPAHGQAGMPNSQRASQRGEDRIVREVRHELLLLPRYSIFDNLSYSVQGGTVTLFGQVRDATLKGDAESAVRHIEGVENVVNNIQILPVSPDDDRIRMQVARALANDSSLMPYTIQSEWPIHIIVDHGNVTLEGVVDREADKTIVEHDVRNISGVFNVTNNLRVGGTQKNR